MIIPLNGKEHQIEIITLYYLIVDLICNIFTHYNKFNFKIVQLTHKDMEIINVKHL